MTPDEYERVAVRNLQDRIASLEAENRRLNALVLIERELGDEIDVRLSAEVERLRAAAAAPAGPSETVAMESLERHLRNTLHDDLDDAHGEEHPEGTCDLCDWAGSIPDILTSAFASFATPAKQES